MTDEEVRNIVADKHHIRQAVLRQRKEMSFDERRLLDRKIAQQVQSLPAFQAAGKIMMYLAVRGEVATDELVFGALAMGKVVTAPRTDVEQKMIEAYVLPSLADVAYGPFGIREPYDKGGICPIGELDLIVVPGLAFTKNGDRLGYGGGYYDRYLERVAPHTVLLGLAYDFQLYPKLPTESFDRRIHVIVSPGGTYFAR